MPGIHTRRELLAASLALAGCAASPQPQTTTKPSRSADGTGSLSAIHKRIGGRLGVYAFDSHSGRHLGYDQDSRYAMASTFKLPLAAALLWQVDRRAFSIERMLPIARKDLLPNSPMVEQRLAEGATEMSVRELCVAAIALSDNSAANILLTGIGGPEGFTSFMRTLGDGTTRLDRNEPDLNSNQPGDPRDTTTPRAMVESLAKIFSSDGFSLMARALLIDWLGAARTGLDRVRAGLPTSWSPGDKTGTGANGAVNDVVAAWPPKRKPVLIAVYMSESKLANEPLIKAHADIGALIAREFAAAG